MGKTTLLWMIFDSIKSSNKVYLDLENPLDQKVFEEIDYNNIWANLKSMGLTENEKAYIFLDEIQSMPKIAQVKKYLYDHYSVKFLVTGSSSFYLKNLFPKSLSGRKFVLELYSLDFQEFLTGAFCIDLVPMYSTNMDRKVSGAKKGYIADNGFLNMFAKVSEGVLLENAVYRNIKQRGPIFYFQKRYGVELDFILPNESLALEVKRTARAQDYNRILGIAGQLNLQNSYIISGKFVDQTGFIPANEL